MSNLGETLLSGTKEIVATNTAERLTTTSILTLGVLVRAAKANLANVMIGSSSVEANSYPLEPGESVQFDLVDPSKIFVYGKEKDKITFLGLVP